MYKLVVFAALLAVAAAAPGIYGGLAAPGIYGGLAAPVSPWGHGIVGAPLVSAPIVKAAVPVATSYANSVRIASPAVAVAPQYAVAAHAPVIAAPYGHAW
ncbi:neuropeptide-like 3 [Ostrinia nubilalis]|uniref:neuropeptide-like 3 n=1 Tax=Ostrinia nubilalis TaxID=29057 RepID=UPI0030822B90